jgi:hypothetical protein
VGREVRNGKVVFAEAPVMEVECRLQPKIRSVVALTRWSRTWSVRQPSLAAAARYAPVKMTEDEPMDNDALESKA